MKDKKPKTQIGTTILIVVLGLASLGFLLYAPFTQWWNDKLHADLLNKMLPSEQVDPVDWEQEIKKAHEYNKKLLSSGNNDDYMEQLNPFGTGIMGRIKIDKIDVDLPIYHTSSDPVLKKGAGHMEETTLPVGGRGTHSAITAHRGLAESKLFTDLDKVGIGDVFSIEVGDKVLAYEVITTRIVKPHETEWLLVEPEKDLITLITCDPLGINSERMLVTGERIFPTPSYIEEDAFKESDLPHFPWWLVGAIVGVGGIAWIARWSSKPPKTVSKIAK